MAEQPRDELTVYPPIPMLGDAPHNYRVEGDLGGHHLIAEIIDSPEPKRHARMLAALPELERQRDELREALEGLVSPMTWLQSFREMYQSEEWAERLEKARQALANTEEDPQ